MTVSKNDDFYSTSNLSPVDVLSNIRVNKDVPIHSLLSWDRALSDEEMEAATKTLMDDWFPERKTRWKRKAVYRRSVEPMTYLIDEIYDYPPPRPDYQTYTRYWPTEIEFMEWFGIDKPAVVEPKVVAYDPSQEPEDDCL